MSHLVGTHSEDTLTPSTKMSPMVEVVLPRRLVPEEANHFGNAKCKVGGDGHQLLCGLVADVATDDKGSCAGGINCESTLEAFEIPIVGSRSDAEDFREPKTGRNSSPQR